MEITLNWIKENYEKYNTLIFKGNLPHEGKFRKKDGKLCDFSLEVSHTKTALGHLRWDGTDHRIMHYTIKISNLYDRNEKDYIDTLVHEMIHFYIAYTCTRDTSPHGKVFKSMMKDLNAKYGLNMSVRTKINAPIIGLGKGNIYTVMTMATKDGRYFVSSVNKKYAKDVQMIADRWGGAKEINWYKTTDPMFATWTKVRKLRGTLFSKSNYERVVDKLKNDLVNIADI